MSHWSVSALCAQVDLESHFPPGGVNGPARALCRKCSVREPCLADALASTAPVSGVWENTSYRERAAMRNPNHQQQPIAKEPTT